MAAPARPRADRTGSHSERRAFVVAGAVLFGVIAVLGVVATFTMDGGGPRPASTSPIAGDRDAGGQAIPRPGEGKAPEDAGDRGGAVQLALAGGLFAVVLGGGAWVAWSGRRGSRGRGRAARSLSRRPRTNG